MSGKNSSGGQYGTAGNAVSVTFVDDYNPICMLFKTFTATGVSAPVSSPSGMGQASVSTYAAGAPTTATVVVQGSADGGNSWVNLPTTNAAPGSPRYTLIRLSCTLVGGTSPTLTVAALVSP